MDGEDPELVEEPLADDFPLAEDLDPDAVEDGEPEEVLVAVSAGRPDGVIGVQAAAAETLGAQGAGAMV